MPRYFFNLIDSGRAVRDDIGREFENAQEVRQYAIWVAVKLARNHSDGVPPAYISVADAQGFRGLPGRAEDDVPARELRPLGDVADWGLCVRQDDPRDRGNPSEDRPLRIKSGELLELVFKEITNCLERGETVKLTSFGSFVVRKKGQRIGRNPKTGREVPISAGRVMMFKPSNTLKLRTNFGPEWRQRRGQVTCGSPSPG